MLHQGGSHLIAKDIAVTDKRHPANRLAQETSPYLLQHAHNPVDWYPWGDEAFEKARREDKPVFLSVGYSACHWCHVMERESFENEAIAAYLNQHYVSIKVDREERPDVDQIYMSAVQLITQRGGWPMSVFMTADGQPFYGGTYWPPTSRMGMPGFQDVLHKLHDYWANRRDEVMTSAAELVAAIGRVNVPTTGQESLEADVLREGARQLVRGADRRHGGFGGAPKFPHPMDLRALLRSWKRFGDEDALAVARLTLDKMSQGGIYDHLGGGFHRYSTDAHWLVPHFEKMLYDNALLIPAYVELFQITGDAAYSRVVRETLDYVLREMTQPEGGFYSTQDADSEGEEGKFFVWTQTEILSVLGDEQGRVFCRAYDVTPGGNWEGHNILNRSATGSLSSASVENASEQVLSECRRKLFDVRSRRIAPGRDDKVLTSWNGMMIAALSQAALVLDEERYLQAAKAAAQFIWHHMRSDAGRLRHSFKDGRARFNAYLDDYACYIDGLTRLYEASGADMYIGWAIIAAEQMLTHYRDDGGSGFFYTPGDHEALITRTKDSQDNATPSGNGMAATALLRLGQLTARDDLYEAGLGTLRMLSGLLAEHPRAAAQALIALDFHLGPSPDVVVVPARDGTGAESLSREISGTFQPNALLIRHPTAAPVSTLLDHHFEGRPAGDRASAYVCLRGSCLAPVQTPEQLAAALKTL